MPFKRAAGRQGAGARRPFYAKEKTATDMGTIAAKNKRLDGFTAHVPESVAEILSGEQGGNADAPDRSGVRPYRERGSAPSASSR